MYGGESYWVASTEDPGHPELEGEHEAAVAVVGGGIVGVTTALLLAREGVEVVLVEARSLGRGTTGYTTGKVTAGHGLVYSRLERGWGSDAARTYAASQTSAVELLRGLVAEHAIACDLEEQENFVFAERESEVPRVEEEAAAAARAGLAASVVRRPEVPFPALAAVRLEGQAQIHARRYVLGLAGAARAAGVRIFEQSRVTGVGRERSQACLDLRRGRVVARHVVLATHVPITSHGIFFARVHPRRVYAIAGELAGPAFEGMWINVGRPTRSLRTAPLGDGERLLVVVGEEHRVGQEPETPERYDRLEAYAKESFPATKAAYAWSTQDAFSVDSLPFVGRVGGSESPLLVATGFGGWGLSGGTLAARLLADAVVGRESSWASLYDAGRAKPARAAARFARENANVAAQLVGGRLRSRPSSLNGIEVGEGRVVALPEGKAAVSRDDDGTLHVVSAVCTHMGCIVAWNAAERTWDCPCHGSRFDRSGEVLEGPATTPLASLEPASVEAA